MGDYSSTVLLPSTDFPMKANLSQREPEFLRRWEEEDLYHKILEQHKTSPLFVLHDGPPYANGHIHIGTALNKILKDIVIKYKTLSGFRAPYVPGWDCHGMPIEHQVFQEIKADKNSVDQREFRKKAAAYALKFQEIQKKEFKRLGILGEWEHPYLTLNPSYEAAIIRTFADLALDGFIYRAFKPIHWCLVCETALAEAEIEYKDDTAPSVFVSFPVKKEFEERFGGPTFFMIWTTTPWTLPANMAIALHPDVTYALVKTAAGTFILAEALAGPVLKKRGMEGTVLRTFTGRELERVVCTNPLDGRDSLVVLANHVTIGDGTGCVHTATGHGEDDYYTGLAYKLPIMSPLDEKGRFTDEVGYLKGLSVWKANPEVIKLLTEQGALFHQEEISHSYPHCWRCKKPVIFRSTRQWFLKIDHHDLRRTLKKEIAAARWFPHEGQNRIGAMVDVRPDWCLSRQRLWGVPLPVFTCTTCKEAVMTKETFDRIESLVREHGSDVWIEKTAEELLPAGFSCPHCGGKDCFAKEKDILDVWFDSGTSHSAVLTEKNGLSWPADVYLEGSDQHRGWFQTSLITACGIRKQAPFRNVITHGFVVDAEGKKMSKSLGNVITPEEVIKVHGAEILRLWTASEDYQQDIRISDQIVRNLVTTYRSVRNTIRFLLGNLADYDPADDAKHRPTFEVDRWAIAKLDETIAKVTARYDDFLFYRAFEELYNYCNVTLSSFYLDYLKDRLYTHGKNSDERKSAQVVLAGILRSLLIMAAPIFSFTAEEAYLHIPWRKKESVFLEAWPEKRPADTGLLERWDRFFEIRKTVLKKLEEKRAEKVIGGSAGSNVTITASPEIVSFLQSFERLSALFMVAEVTLVEREGEPIVTVEKTAHQKCQRCWTHHPTVGGNPAHNDLCEKCAVIVTKEKGEPHG